MLSTPLRSVQSPRTTSRATSCFALASRSSAYTKMFVSTKVVTVMQLRPGRELPPAERLTAAKPLDRGVARPIVRALSLHQPRELAAQERGHREATPRRPDPSPAQG